MNRKAQILEWAAEGGVSGVRVARLGSGTPRMDAFDRWRDAGHHGEMAYLSRGRDIRANPRDRLAMQSVCSFSL